MNLLKNIPVLCCLYFVLGYSQFIKGQSDAVSISVDNFIDLECYIEITNGDTLFYPQRLDVSFRIINKSYHEFALIIGAVDNKYTKSKQYGIFYMQTDNKLVDLYSRSTLASCIQYGDTISMNCEKWPTSTFFPKFSLGDENYKTIINLLSSAKFYYHPIVKDYEDMVGAYFLKKDEPVIFSNCYLIIYVNVYGEVIAPIKLN